MLQPGEDGEPLPEATPVFRIAKNNEINDVAASGRRALEILFKPTSDDEKSPGQRLSIWVEEMTLPDQAWAIMGFDPKKTIVACLNSDDVMAVDAPEPFEGLRAEWEAALLTDGGRNNQPGAEGHAGIHGLIQGGDGKLDKARRKDMRSKLADKARISPVPVPHNIPEEEIRAMANAISLGAGSPTPEACLVHAIRSLRRARAMKSPD